MNTILNTEMEQENQKSFNWEEKSPSYGLLHNDADPYDYEKERAADRLLAYKKLLQKHVASIEK